MASFRDGGGDGYVCERNVHDDVLLMNTHVHKSGDDDVPKRHLHIVLILSLLIIYIYKITFCI